MKNKSGLPGFVILVIVGIVLITAFRWLRPAPTHPVPAAFANAMTLQQTIEASTKDGRPVLAFVTADWCGPCQAFKAGTLSDPAITQLLTSATHPVLIDVTKDNPEAASLKIFSIPAMLLLKDGREVARLEGVASADKLRSWLQAATAPAQR